MNVNFYINAMKTWDKTKPVSYRDSIKTKDLAVKKKVSGYGYDFV